MAPAQLVISQHPPFGVADLTIVVVEFPGVTPVLSSQRWEILVALQGAAPKDFAGGGVGWGGRRTGQGGLGAGVGTGQFGQHGLRPACNQVPVKLAR